LCMLICIFDTGHMTMSLSVNTGISEEELAESAPLARALVLQRLEMVWRSCEPHINGDAGKPDPRFVEAGIRVLDRLMRLYRLDSPQAPAQAAVEHVDAVALVESGLLALEEKLGSS
jgi:hypothetical protein